MGTFLESYRPEKLSKSHGVSDKSITIGIPMQMSICRRPSFQVTYATQKDAHGNRSPAKANKNWPELFIPVIDMDSLHKTTQGELLRTPELRFFAKRKL